MRKPLRLAMPTLKQQGVSRAVECSPDCNLEQETSMQYRSFGVVAAQRSRAPVMPAPGVRGFRMSDSALGSIQAC